jgi:hypothetical protein
MRFVTNILILFLSVVVLIAVMNSLVEGFGGDVDRPSDQMLWALVAVVNVVIIDWIIDRRGKS